MASGQLRDAADLLADRERSLAEAIEDALGMPPVLELVAESLTPTPHSSWVAGAFPGQADLLVRMTSYRVGPDTVSRNVSAVDLGYLGPEMVDDLRSGRTSLRELFHRIGVHKCDHRGGRAAETAHLPEPLRGAFPPSTEPMVWRSYRAAYAGETVCLVFEALPVTTWGRLLASRRTATAGGRRERHPSEGR